MRTNAHKDERAASLISQYAAEYLLTESSPESLITVTKTEMSDRGRRALIFLSVLPTEKEAAALTFAKRKCNDFRLFVQSKKSFGFAPRFDFALDYGERNRQRIDELSNQG